MPREQVEGKAAVWEGYGGLILFHMGKVNRDFVSMYDIKIHLQMEGRKKWGGNGRKAGPREDQREGAQTDAGFTSVMFDSKGSAAKIECL